MNSGLSDLTPAGLSIILILSVFGPDREVLGMVPPLVNNLSWIVDTDRLHWPVWVIDGRSHSVSNNNILLAQRNIEQLQETENNRNDSRETGLKLIKLGTDLRTQNCKKYNMNITWNIDSVIQSHKWINSMFE